MGFEDIVHPAEPESVDNQEEQTREEDHNFQFMPDREQRQLLAIRMVALVDHIREGDEQARALVFLDKSARPLSTLFRDLWHKMEPNQVAPPINFINVGQELVERLLYQLGEKYRIRARKELIDSLETHPERLLEVMYSTHFLRHSF